jgi:hypothetical protein
MRARGIERDDALTGLHEKDSAVIDDLTVAVLAHETQRDRCRRVLGQAAQTRRRQPVLFPL